MMTAPISPVSRLAHLLVVLCLLVLATCTPGDADEPPEPSQSFRSLGDDLELRWTFEASVDATIIDVSGNGRHGTLQAGASLVGSPNGGEAVALDGVDDYVSLIGPRDPALYGGADGSFTLSARVKLADVSKILDISGNERHGQNLGGSFVASQDGVEALSLDGVDDKVSLVGPRALSLYGGETGEFTLSTRIKLAGADQRRVDRGHAGRRGRRRADLLRLRARLDVRQRHRRPRRSGLLGSRREPRSCAVVRR